MIENPMTQALEVSTLVELLNWRAAHESNRHAYSFLRQGEQEEASITYGELGQRARAIGTLLQSRGATGTPVMLLHPPSIDYIAAFFGCLYAGAIAVPAYPPFSVRMMPRIHAIVSDTQAKIVLTASSTLTDLKRCFAHLPELENLEWFASDAIPVRLSDEWEAPEIDGDSLAFLQYTSGSTSVPKGVMVTHHNLLHNLDLLLRYCEQTPNSHMVSWLPPYHDMGLIAGILSPLHVGYPATLMSPVAFLQRPLRWLQTISRVKATMSIAPNFAYGLCARKVTPEQLRELDLSTWQLAANGAEPIRAETLDLFVNAFGPCGFRREAFFPGYGLAEGTLIVATGKKMGKTAISTVQKTALEEGYATPAVADDQETRKIIGYTNIPSEQKVVIVNPNTHIQCTTEQVGEIWVSGPSVANGYWHKPEETEKIFHARISNTGEGPFLRTGDLGFLQNGKLFVTGRLKDLIIIRGRNHYPQDIELTTEHAHSAIRLGCCVAFPVDIEGQEQLIVLAEIDQRYQSESKQADGENIINAIQRHIVEQHDVQAHQIVLLKAGGVLKTSSGKLQRRACKAEFLNGNLTLWEE